MAQPTSVTEFLASLPVDRWKAISRAETETPTNWFVATAKPVRKGGSSRR